MAASQARTSPIAQSADSGPIFHFPDLHSTDQPHSPDSTVSEDSENNEHYSFTPRQLPRGPRAWQRQPSQPFAPRNDAQKIWKRAPLKNITSEINIKWKRGADEDDGVVRPAKRLKLNQMYAEGKENEEVEMAPGFLPTLGNAESPRNAAKDAVTEDTEPLPQDRPLENDHDRAEATPEAGEPSSEAALEHEQDPSEGDIEDYRAEESDDMDQPESPTMDDEQEPLGDDPTEAEPAPEMCFDVTPTTSLGGDVSEEASPGIASDGRIVAELDPSKDMASQINALLHNEPHIASNADLSAPDHSSVSPPRQNVTQADANNLNSASLAAPQQSRPSVQPEEDDTAFLQQFLQRAKEAREKNPSLQLYRPVGDRVKRHLIEQHNQASATSPQANDRKRPLSPEPEDLSQIDSPEEPTVTTTVIIPSVDEVTEKPPSPSRRSNRLNANTKLPRPQRPTALPSNISLRRLNGTEFISMAKQRTEAQNAAMTTRNNTRKNKGSALSVQQKLEQIKLGFARDADHTSAIGANHIEAGRVKKTKVRKKTGVEYDHIMWAQKIARYQKDGEEHTLTIDGSWETDAVSTADNVERDDEEVDNKQVAEAKSDDLDTKGEPENKQSHSKKSATSNSSTPKKTTRASSSSTKSKSKVKTPADKSDDAESSSTTRHKSDMTKRKRAETIGTVNGTPAPKRGLDAMLESARDNEGVVTALGLADREGDGETKGHEATGAGTRGSKRLKAKQSAAAK